MTYEVNSAAGGYLSIGKLTARLEKSTKYGVPSAHEVAAPQSLVPHSSSGPFTVTTPTAVITDLGTEFGVNVHENGVCETQVLDGDGGGVTALGVTNSTRVGAARTLVRGQAIRIVSWDAPMEPVPFKTGQFVRQMGSSPAPPSLRDDFNATRNYLTEGTSNTVWKGILNAKTASRIDTLPAELGGVKQTGCLVLAVPKGANAGWAEPHRSRTFKNAPYVYMNVPKGDFEARVRIGGITKGNFSACGLMAQLDNDNFVSVNRIRVRRVKIRRPQ